jgi:hypothetical protein
MFSMTGMSGGGRLTHAQRAAQHSVQWTAGSLRDLQAFFWLQVYTALKQFSRQPPLTQTVSRFLTSRKHQ